MPIIPWGLFWQVTQCSSAFLAQLCLPALSPGSARSLTTVPLICAHLLQEEEALLSEMDVTGQAFEDMQEQNGRLLQQLREKDDANFKLMSERIKANQIHKLLREEKDELGEQVLGLKSQVWPLWACGGELERLGPSSTEPTLLQVDAQLLTVQKLEEKERALQGNLGGVEKELTLRSQALELNKRKVRLDLIPGKRLLASLLILLRI